MIQNKLCNVTKYKSQLAKHSKCRAPFNHKIIVIPSPSVYDMLTITILGVISQQEVLHGWSQLKPFALLEIFLPIALFFYTVLGWATYSLPFLWVSLTQGNIYSFKEHREKPLHHRLSNSDVGSGLSETKATFWPLLSWDSVSFFALLPNLLGLINLTHFYWDFFLCKNLLISHKVTYKVSQ